MLLRRFGTRNQVVTMIMLLGMGTTVRCSGLSVPAQVNQLELRTPGDDEPADPAFIDRVHRALLYGEPVSAITMRQLKGETRAQVVDILMKDQRFATTTLDFGYFFLGKPDALSTLLATAPSPDGSIREHLAGSAHPDWLQAPLRTVSALFPEHLSPSAHSSSHANNSGLLTLLEPSGPTLALLPFPPTDWNDLPMQVQDLLNREPYDESAAHVRRQMILDATAAALHSFHFEAGARADCDTLVRLPSVLQLTRALGDHDALLEQVHSKAARAFTLARETCADPGQPLSDTQRFAIRDFADAWSQHSNLMGLITQKLHTRFWGSDVFNLSAALSTLGIESPLTKSAADLSAFFRQYRNSSTNANRSRAAAILRTYFCDDLSPLSLADLEPKAHAEERHASDASCRACHARLDPLAGFFKSHGLLGINFHSDPSFGGLLDEFRQRYGMNPSEPFMIFDDLSIIVGSEVADYRSQWLPPTGQTAYVRSNLQSQLNKSGDSLNDLFSIIKEAPEVRTCMTRRLLDYFVGPKQSFPQVWVDQLARGLSQQADPIAAYRQTVKRILLSATFAQDDPVPGVCYEAFTQRPKELTCEIESLLQKNCVMCHSQQNNSGGLALDRIGHLEDGRLAFAHSRDGCQVDPATTLQAIVDSLSTTNTARRMPLLKHIDPFEREDLLNWTKRQMTLKMERQGAISR
jgi:hypothetical protein